MIGKNSFILKCFKNNEQTQGSKYIIQRDSELVIQIVMDGTAHLNKQLLHRKLGYYIFYV